MHDKVPNSSLVPKKNFYSGIYKASSFIMHNTS